MINWLKGKIQHHYHHPKYFVLMLTLCALILLPALVAQTQSGQIMVEVTYGAVIGLSMLFAASNFKELFFFFLLGGSIYFLFLYQGNEDNFDVLNGLLTLLYFVLVFWNILRYILKERKTTENTIFACISGYLILGILGAPLLSMIALGTPNAYAMDEAASFYDFIYLSFITLTSVGYGDITPVAPIAKATTIILSIAGQLYLTFIVAIIIGKYLWSAANPNATEN